MDIESQAGAIVSHWWANGSILGTSAAGYCEVPWRTCTLCWPLGIPTWEGALGVNLFCFWFLFHIVILYNILNSMHSIAFFCALHGFGLFSTIFSFLKQCLHWCAYVEFPDLTLRDHSSCLLAWYIFEWDLNCWTVSCSNNARFRAQLQVRLPTTAHKEKQYHNMLETGHGFRGWYSVAVRILHGCEDRMMLPRIGGFLIWICCPLGRKILQGTHQRWLGKLPRQRIVSHGCVIVIPL